jgi:quinol monooxygenase YgiN
MERPTRWEVEKMPIQSKLNFMRWPLLHIWAMLVLFSCCLAVVALAQEPGAHDRIYVVTHADLLGPNMPAGKKLLQQYVADSRKDKGCLRIEVYEQVSRLNHHMIVEVWESQQAFDAHLAAAHTVQFRHELDPMLGSPYDERLHHLLE